jgi:hypothetical protein
MENFEKTKATVNTGAAKYGKGAKITIIAVCAFLAAVLVFGIVFGSIIAARNASYVMTCDGFGIDTGVASYLVSYFKARYVTYMKQSGITVTDTPEFWASPTGVFENTYGDYLKYETEEYVKQLIAACALFDQNATLSDADKKAIKVATDEILDFRHGGSKSDFNAATEQYGFDYDDFCRGTEMIYKAWAVSVKLFGSNGENMTSYPEFRDSYLGNYTRVKLLFIRTDNKFVTDENGNRVKGDNGNDLTVDLTDEEKAVREARINELREVINGINDGTIAPERFDELLNSDYNEGDRSAIARNGYYFNKSSTFTAEFSEGLPEVVEKSLELEINTATEINCSFGVCFALREQVAEGAYENTDASWCFGDYNALAASELYQQMLKEISERVEVRDKWSDISPIAIPYTSDYTARL